MTKPADGSGTPAREPLDGQETGAGGGALRASLSVRGGDREWFGEAEAPDGGYQVEAPPVKRAGEPDRREDEQDNPRLMVWFW